MTSNDKYYCKSNWMGIELNNPIMLGSITSISHSTINDHIEFFKRIEETQIGAIILESFVCIEFGSDEKKIVQNDIVSFKTGLIPNLADNYMGYALQGPIFPNVSSIRYGRRLISSLVKKINTPIFASLINIGNIEKYLSILTELSNSGVKGIELNFGCPNVKNNLKVSGQAFTPIPLSVDLLREIKEHCSIPYWIKIPGGKEHFENVVKLLEKDTSLISGLTLSNAYSGLVPPKLDNRDISVFGRSKYWSSSGIYGPFERLLTYQIIHEIRSNTKYKDVQLSACGGFVSPEHAVEALLLGANTIQIASGLLWKGPKILSQTVAFLNKYIESNGFLNISELSKNVRKNIKKSVNEIPEYVIDEINTLQVKNQRPPMATTSKCISCKKCYGTGCFAVKISNKNKIYIDKDLCSGCGWCQIICKTKGALERS